jgi:hypothetical protein
MRLRHIAPLIVAWSLAAAEVRLTPEQPLGPEAAESQRSVRTAGASGHLLAVWRDDESDFNKPSHLVAGSFDGVRLSFARTGSETRVSAPAVAAGNQTFLVAWSEFEFPGSGRVRARRVANSGAILDDTPLELCRGSEFAPGLVFDGTAFAVACTGRDTTEDNFVARVVRVTESGSVTDDVPPRMVDSDVRLLRANDRLLFAGAVYGFYASPIVYPFARVAVYDANGVVGDNGGHASGRFISDGAGWSAAAGPDRVIVAMFSSFLNGRILLAQTSLEPVTTRPPYRPQELPDRIAGEGTIVWNGGEYVLVWTELASASAVCRVRGIRLNRAGDPIDGPPFDISDGAAEDAPALTVTNAGVVITYGRWIDSVQRRARAFTRTLERLPAPSTRRAAVRH